MTCLALVLTYINDRFGVNPRRRFSVDIYDYAMQLEKDGEALYTQAAAQSANAGIATILNMLADAERNHYALFKRMQQHESPEVRETPILADIKNIFVEIREKGGLEGLPFSDVEVYRTAQEIEKKTEAFYTEKANELKGQPQETVFLKIASEEQKHFRILQNIIDFVFRPAQWLENAEWHHLEEY